MSPKFFGMMLLVDWLLAGCAHCGFGWHAAATEAEVCGTGRCEGGRQQHMGRAGANDTADRQVMSHDS